MSDWQPGDLALCVRSDPLGLEQTRPGGVYTVKRVAIGIAPDGVLGSALQLHEAPHPRVGSDDRRFRKIKPLTDAEREEALRDLKAPVREPAA